MGGIDSSNDNAKVGLILVIPLTLTNSGKKLKLETGIINFRKEGPVSHSMVAMEVREIKTFIYGVLGVVTRINIGNLKTDR